MDEFIRTLIAEVKSQGVFDEFRFNCCLADVDTKPAYQNVRTRVETAVNDFLAKQHWTPDTNKIQLRERLRKHLLDSEVLDTGVDQIVDQVVNPKVATIFEPKIESIVYKYLGIIPPPPPPRPAGPLLPAPPLPPFAGHMNGSSLLRVETGAGELLPTDLEQISPDSDQATIKSDPKEESKDDDLPPGVDDERNYDEDTSPSYEPLSEDKPGSSKEIKNGLLNHSDSVNGVSQASQLSQVSSDSRLTIGSSTESVAEAQQATPAHNSGELTANMPANISEEAQMPKFSENSSDASAAVDGESGYRRLHFDIKQDAITFEGTERRNSVSNTNGAPLVLSIEDAIMSEVKANIDDVNNASIELEQPPLPPLPKVEPELVQPPAPPDVESVPVPPPPPPPPEIKEEPVRPPAPPPPEIKEEPVRPPAPPPPEIKEELVRPPAPPPPEIKEEPVRPPAPPEMIEDPVPAPPEVKPEHAEPPSPPAVKEAPVEPPPPPELKPEPSPKVKPPPTPPPTESSIGSPSGDLKPKERESPQVKTDAMEPQELPTVADEVREEKPKNLAPPEQVEAPKEKISKASESIASPTSVSSQSKSSSRDKDKSKERRNHSHSDDKQRRRSRDRDRDRSRDKSHSKHSSSSSSKHSSSHSSSSKHRSSSSKNDKSSTSSSSKSHRESSSSKRTSSTSSSRHESSSSSHKKHKSSSSSSRSDRDKDRDKEKDSHSRSHHSNSSSSSSSKRKDQDRGRDRDRNKSSSATTAPIQDDHNESKTKLNKRRGSDSNDEGKPPSSGGPPKSSQPEIAPEKAAESVENGNGTNGNSNGGSGSNGACDSLSSGVVIVSDLLQQSSTSFIELTAGCQSQKEEDSSSKPQRDEKVVEQTEEIATQEDRLSGEPQVADKAESVPDSPVEESKEGDGLEAQPAEVEKPQAANPAETETSEPAEGSLPEDMQKEAVKPENLPAPQDAISSGDDPRRDELADDLVTHFEDNSDEFEDRLQLINKLIEHRQNLLSQLSADHSQIEAAHIRAIRKSISKRRWSSHQEQQEVGRESSPPPRFGSPGSSTSGSPTKRLRREEPKSSPTPSEASVNSKENEALEKQEHDALNARRFSQKLCQQQRYTNDDLYKPRPILSQRSRRRGLDSIL